MSNYNLFNKNELSYIFNNRKKFCPITIDEIAKYCEQKNYSIAKIKSKKPIWRDNFRRLEFSLIDNKIIISKTKETKEGDYFGIILTIILIIGLLLIVIFYIVFKNVVLINVFISIPLLLVILKVVLDFEKKARIKLKNKRHLEIFPSSKVLLIGNGVSIKEHYIHAINLFWKDAEGTPDAVLDLKINNKISIEVDAGSNYLELFQIGDEISQLLKKRMNVFCGYNSQKKVNL